MKPSTEKILKALQGGEELTIQKSIRLCGVSALSQRVGELRHAGHQIRDRWVRNGESRYKAYYL